MAWLRWRCHSRATQHVYLQHHHQYVPRWRWAFLTLAYASTRRRQLLIGSHSLPLIRLPCCFERGERVCPGQGRGAPHLDAKQAALLCGTRERARGGDPLFGLGDASILLLWVIFRGSILHEVVLHGVMLHGVILRGVVLRGAVLLGGVLLGASLPFRAGRPSQQKKWYTGLQAYRLRRLWLSRPSQLITAQVLLPSTVEHTIATQPHACYMRPIL